MRRILRPSATREPHTRTERPRGWPPGMTAIASAPTPQRRSLTASTRPSRAGATGIQDPALPSETYTLTDTRFYTAPDQELSTAGYPTGDNRAIKNGTGHTTAVDASCDHCDRTSLRNVQVRRRGTRAPPLTHAPPRSFGNRRDRTITTGGCSIPISCASPMSLMQLEYVCDVRAVIQNRRCSLCLVPQLTRIATYGDVV